MQDLATRITEAPLGHTYLFSIGQAGFIIKSAAGQLLAIDLYLSDYVEEMEKSIGSKRLLPKLLEAEELAIDVIICTHPHLDHFDEMAVPQMMKCEKSKLMASVDCERLVDKYGIEKSRSTFVKPGDSVVCGDFKVDFVNCDHGSGAPDAVGVVVYVDGKTIYEAGDTCLRLDRVHEIAEKGPIDILIAPINGAYGNMNEEDCAIYSAHIKPGLTIPCHYGMFASHGGSPRDFMKYMEKYCPENEYLLMCQGEMMEI